MEYYDILDKQNLNIKDNPDKCPLCHKAMDPIFIRAQESFETPLLVETEVVYKCTYNKCRSFFISYYENCEFDYSAPWLPETLNLDENIKKLSPRFVEIYTQALKAKSFHLTELVGIGLRKALEILIKDFCIFHQKIEENEIVNMTLNDCIKKYCGNKVKICADKSRVLGNDETHYKRKYLKHDVTDLEKLVGVTIYWVGAELITQSYENLVTN